MTEKAETGKSDEGVVATLEKQLVQMGEVSSGELGTPSEVKGPQSAPKTEGAESGKDAKPDAVKVDQPAETNGSDKPPVVEDDIPDIPEGTNPNSENWKKLRGKAESYKDEAKREREARMALEKQLEESRKVPTEAPKQEGKEIPDDTVFSLLVGAKAGQFGEERNNKQVLADAKLLINDMPSNRILAVLRKAESGQLGEDSPDVVVAAKEALVLALARERENDGVREENAKKTGEYQTKVTASLREAANKYPDMNKEGTELEKFSTAFVERMLGKVVDGKLQPGPLASLMADPSYPVVMADLAHNAFLASTVKGLQAQVDELTKKLNSGRTPQPPGGPASGSGTGESETERTLKGMGNISQG